MADEGHLTYGESGVGKWKQDGTRAGATAAVQKRTPNHCCNHSSLHTFGLRLLDPPLPMFFASRFPISISGGSLAAPNPFDTGGGFPLELFPFFAIMTGPHERLL